MMFVLALVLILVRIICFSILGYMEYEDTQNGKSQMNADDAMLMFILVMTFAEIGLVVYLVDNLAQAFKWFFFKVGMLIYQTKKIIFSAD